MKLEDFKNADPVLIVYPAGLGGEHIAYTLSVCCDDFEDLYTYVNKSVNQYHTICALGYMSLVEDITKFENGLEYRYDGDFIKNKKRIILKDHPHKNSIDFYKKYLPDITIIYIDLSFPKKYSIEYFVNLAIKKLAVRVDCPITHDYIKSTLSNTLTEEQQNYVIEETKKFDWVWRHELYKLIDDMLNLNDAKLEHYSTTDKLKNDHKSNLINTYITFLPEYKSKFRNLHVVDCDNLEIDSTVFWNKIKKIIPNLDIERAIKMTNYWITNNNNLGLNNE